jgi:hypothetical protein
MFVRDVIARHATGPPSHVQRTRASDEEHRTPSAVGPCAVRSSTT